MCDACRMTPGACLCGAIRYEADAADRLLHCHCSLCRKHHGAPFATFVEALKLRWLAGEGALLAYPSSSTRTRRACVTCGSVAPASAGDRVLVPAGNLLAELNVVEGLHMFVDSKPKWHVIGDKLPQHDQAPPGWTTGDIAIGEAPPTEDGATGGSCLCGAVTFSVRGAPARWLQCHCSRCRRGRSAAHGSNTFYATDQFAWLMGRELVRSYKPADAERFTVSFCVRCGGSTPVERPNVPFILVPAALFDADPGALPQGHIFVASKAAWYPIQDSLPQFAELPPA